MILLPFEKTIIATKLNSEEIKRRLGEVIQAPRAGWRPTPQGGRFFEGEIENYDLKINRVINYGPLPWFGGFYENYFLPIIKGKIEGSTLTVTMGPSFLAIIFMCGWFGFTGLSFFACLTNSSRCDSSQTIGFGFLFLFVYMICMMGFKPEAAIASKKLKEILGVV